MKKYLSMFLMVAGLVLASCNRNELKPGPVTPPDVEENPADVKVSSTVSSLSFSWDSAEDVYQYIYSLSLGGNHVSQGITRKTEMLFKGLVSSTKYKFGVTALNTSGQAVRIFTSDGRTDDIVKLETPASVKVKFSGADIKISWQPVESADFYSYTVTGGDITESGTTEDSSLVLTDYPDGTYVIAIVAESEAEEFSVSDAATCEFVVTTELVDTIAGTFEHYTDPYGDPVLALSVDCQMEVYGNGVYVIKNFLGGGRDFRFTLNDDGTFNFLSGVASGVYVYVYTGLSSLSYLAAYLGDGYYGYVLDDEDDGSSYIYFYGYDSDGEPCYDSFIWNLSE